MNLILLDSAHTSVILGGDDPRTRHIAAVLRRKVGDTVDVGLPDGRIGKAEVLELTNAGVALSVAWTGESPRLHPITLILGMPRPQTARRLLREMTSLGVCRLAFCGTERSEPGYRKSKLWTSGEWKRHLRAGAEQAFNPRLPALTLYESLAAGLAEIESSADCIAMDNYEAPESLATWHPNSDQLVLALGAERGWSATERMLLRQSGFQLYHMGDRVLRMDTAAIACLSVAISQMRLA